MREAESKYARCTIQNKNTFLQNQADCDICSENM